MIWMEEKQESTWSNQTAILFQLLVSTILQFLEFSTSSWNIEIVRELSKTDSTTQSQ